ncbi:unnamed protein product [Durusdinium trenchii]|uniref:MORN repeat-containing protein n=2 Tax=Durusdinium trenchii TaxID=1381693 RepID=A0ABP0LK50_9DINO
MLCCDARPSPETEELFGAPSSGGYVTRKPHVVLSTKYQGFWLIVSKQIKAGLEKVGCSVYNPNTDNVELCKKMEIEGKADDRWLLSFEENLDKAKATRGFLLQVQQGLKREKTFMQEAEEKLAGYIDVPKIGLYAVENIQFLPDCFQGALEKAQAQWATGIRREVEMASEVFEALPGQELPIKDGFITGKAKCIFPEGSIYVGDLERSRKHGRGKEIWPDGSSYEGDFVHEKAQGRGLLRLVNGDVYEGEFAHDKRHGKGLYRFANGMRETGWSQWDEVIGLGVRRGRGYQKLQDGAVVKEVTEEEAKQLVKENGLPSLW